MTAVPTVPVPSAAPSAADRPRWTMRGFLGKEWGVMVLAFVLSVMTWMVVREGVEQEIRIEDVTAQPVTSGDEFWAWVAGPVDITLRGPRGEVERARAQLARRAGVVTLRVDDLAPTRNERPLAENRDRYDFPFPSYLVLDAPLPAGTVFRMAEHVVNVEPPEVRIPAEHQGLVPTVTVVPDRITLRAPKSAMDPSIKPDPIVESQFPERGPVAGVPMVFPLTFTRWRADIADDQSRPGPRASARSGVVLPKVDAKIVFEPTVTREVENDVHAFPRGVRLEVSSPVDGLKGDRYAGSLTATVNTLQDIEEQKGRWIWALVLPESELARLGSAERLDGASALLRWQPIDPVLMQKHVRGLARFNPTRAPGRGPEEKSVLVTVTRAR